MTRTNTADTVHRCQQALAHAWMVRTFVKHSEEAEEFPELTELPRAVFDVCRAVEHLTAQPDEYLRILRKKLRGLRAAAEKFAHDAPLASAHTNFEQAVISILAVCESLEQLAREDPSQQRVPTAVPMPRSAGQPSRESQSHGSGTG